jgi:Cu/Ag efflux protein CusF
MKKIQDARLLVIALLALVLMSSGCTSTSLELPANSPARVDAPSGRVKIEPAAILHPDAPLYPSDGPAVSAELENRQLEQVAVSKADDPAPEGTREAPYVGQGVIQRIGEGQLEIQHEAIPGFMGAMRMTFSISEEAMNDSLEVGDEIIFKIEAHPEHGYQIFSVDAVAAE